VPDSPRPRRGRLRLFGFLLAVYGLVGLALFVAVAVAVNRPLERAHELTASLDEQRAALVDTMNQARTTLEDMSLGVGAADQSLADAKAATDRAATISNTLATTMFGLRDSMSISIFGTQPLAGLAAGFDNSGQQISALGTDLATIGQSLNDNRTTVSTTATNLAKLAVSLGELTALVRDSNDVEISTSSLDAVRLAVYAICGWLAVLALGCVIGGVYLFRLGGRHRLPAD
jgi:phage-related protein